MPRVRTQFFMQNTKNYGWSETYYSSRTTLEAAMVDALFLFPKRVQLNGIDTFLTYIRVSDDEVKRDSQVFNVPLAAQNPKSTELGPSEDANTCLDVSLRAAPTRRRFVYMRGIPDNIVKDGGNFDPSATWQANFAIWSAALAAGAWGLQSLNEAAGETNITNMTQNGTTGVVTVTTALPHGLTPGGYANILAVGGSTRARGVQKILDAPTPTTFTYKITKIMQPYTGGGKARAIAWIFSSFTSAQVLKVSHRDTGRPFGSPRGRRRVI